MKKFTFTFVTLVLSFLFVAQSAFSQTASWNYTSSTAASSPVSMTGATLFGAGGDDNVRTGSFPFSFQVYDNVFSTSDAIRLSTNGFLGFIVPLTGTGSFGNATRLIDGIPTNYAQNNYVKGDFLSYGGHGDGAIVGNIMHLTTGTAPNQVYTIEFTYYPLYNGTYNATVQLSFYQSTNVITIDYSNISGSLSAGIGAHLGINLGDGVFGTHVGNIPTSSTRIILTPGVGIQEPISLSATKISSEQINLTWQKNAAANDVIITYNTTNTFTAPTSGVTYTTNTEIAAGQGRVLYQGSLTNFSHTLLAPNQIYYYRVWSMTSTHLYSSLYKADNATTDPVLDPTPFNVTGVSASQIDLSWVLNSAGDDVIVTWNTSNNFTAPTYPNSYTVGAQIAPGLGTVLYKGTSTSTSHTSLSTNTTYHYKIWSFNGQNYYSSPGLYGSSMTSSTANPTAFTSVASSTCNINLGWTKNSSSHDVMVVYNTTNSFTAPVTGQTYSANNTLGQDTILYVGANTTFPHTPIKDNKTYYYKAYSFDAAHNYSSGLASTANTALIANVTGLATSTVSSTQINISWTQNTAGDNVIILYNPTSNTFGNLTDGNSYVNGTPIAGGGTVLGQGNLASIAHTGLSINEDYFYKVISFDCAKNYSSGLSTSGTTGGVSDPQSLSITSASSCEVGLAWTKNTTSNDVVVAFNYANSFGTPINGVGYNVNYAFPGGQGTIIYIGSATAFTHSPLFKNQAYHYKIWSKDGSNNYSTGIIADTTTNQVLPPTGLSAASAGTNQIDLTWALNSVSDSIMIAWSPNGSFQTPIDGVNYDVNNFIQGQGKVLYKGTAAAFSHTGLTLNTAYYYKAWSFDCGKNYSTGVTDNETTDNIASPLTFTATTASASQINLAWTQAATSTVIITYNLTGSFSTPVDGTPYVQGGTVGGDAVIYKGTLLAFQHTALSTNTTYYYKIWNVNASNYYSNGLTADATTTGINDPSSFSATAINASKITLVWAANSNSDSVMITYNTVNNFAQPQNGVAYPLGNQIASGQGFVLYRGLANSITSYSHLGLNANTKYYYKIWSYNNGSNYYSTPGILDSATTNFPGIATFPHITDFETQTTVSGNPSCSSTYYLLTDWVNVTGDNKDWIPRTGATPYTATGPNGDNTTSAGTGNYVYAGSYGAGYCNNQSAWLVSPLYNFQNLTNPKLEFYYHMYGSSMGRLSVQVSTNGGNTWSSDIYYKQGQQHTSPSANYTMADISLAAYAGMSNIKIRIVSLSGASSYTSDMAVDDIKVYEPQLMNITSVITEQDTLPVISGSVNQQIIRVKVTTVGAYSPITLSEISLNTTGTTALSDITNAKIYYTGNDPNFSATQQIGSPIAIPTSSFTIVGNKVLAEGINYFWLTYNIPATAVIGNFVDASCTNIKVSGVNYTPSITSPTQVKQIIGQITVGTGTASNWNGPIYPSYYAGAHESIYLASDFGAVPKEINKIEWYKASGNNITNQISDISIYMKNSTTSSLSSGSYSLTGYTLVYQGAMPNDKVTGWLGVNLDNTFLYDGTSNVHVLVIQAKPVSTWYPYPYWAYTTVSPNKARGAYSTTTVGNLQSTSQRPNARFEYVWPLPMVYQSSTVEQPITSNVGLGSTNQEIIRVKIETQNTAYPLSVTALNFNITGSTAAADISAAKVYYTGTNDVLSTTTAFGSTTNNPTGAFTVTGTQPLTAGTNYFWLVYDISSSATVNNVVDATCTSITVGGVAKVPTVTAPTGNRKIKQYLIIGTGTYSSFTQPLHTYYYHGWEGIYLQSEIGTAKDISALAFYKASGANVTNDILNVTIYMKHTSDVTTITGAYSTTGYTQVYSGNFPNNAPSGWMEVPLSQDFSYNGTDNIEVLIVQSYGAYFNGQPYWAYRTVSPNRARYADSWSAQPTTLTASNQLANIRFEHAPPQPMAFVSTKAIQNNITNITAGVNDQEIIGVEIVTQNSSSPLSATSFTFNTTGCSNPSNDITNAKVYYTANGSTFAATNQFGSVVANPNGSFTVTGSQVLNSGINYFWLAYDLPTTATTGNWVDAQCTSVTVGSVRIPTVTNPMGNRAIVGALSGYYTIGSTGDYTSFTAAISALNTYGVSGWVTFQVQSGTYSEKITLAAVTNASAANKITFESLTGDSTDVILTYSASTYNDAATVKYDGAQYFVFQNMTVTATGTYGHAFEIAGGAINNVIRNNVLYTSSTNFTYGSAIFSYPGTNAATRIVQNKIQSVGAAIYLRGTNTATNTSGWEIDSNVISADQYGIYLYYASNNKLRSNHITMSSSGATGYGIYAYYAVYPMEISGNKIVMQSSNQAYGAYVYSSSGVSTNRVQVYNNFFANVSNASTASVGLYLRLSNYVNVYYNNFNNTASSGTTRAGLYAYQGNNVQVKNNCFASPGGGFTQYYFTSGIVSSSNYNNMYSTGNIGYYNGNNVANLAAWKTATSQDANSVSLNPNYTSTTDLHVGNLAMDNLGSPITGINIDIDGASRHTSTPDIGADEFGVDVDAGILAITNPISPLCGSGSQSVKVDLKNYGLVALTSATINWKVGGTLQSAYAWTGNLAPGSTVNVTLGNANFAIGTQLVEAWSTNPNSIADQYPANDSASTSIIVGDNPTAFAGNDATVCASLYITNGATATGYTSILWSTSGTGFFSNGTAAIATYNPSAADYSAGSVYLKISAINTTCGTATDSLLLNISQPAAVSFTGLASQYCSDAATVTLVGTPTGGTFSGSGISGSTFNPATATIGNNSIKYVYVNGICSDSSTQIVTVNSTPTVVLNGLATAYCDNSNVVTLSGTPAGGSFGGVGVAGNKFNPSQVTSSPSSVWYSYTNGTTGCSATDTNMVIVNTAPTANAGTDAAIAFLTTTTLSGSATGGTGTISYVWAPSSQLVNANIQSPTTLSMILTTIFDLTVTDANNCSDVDQVTITVTAPILITQAKATPDTVCLGSTTQLQAITTGGNGTYTHTWTSNPSGFTSSSQNPIATPTQSAWYIVLASDGSLSFTDSVYVVVNPVPTVSYTGLPATACNNADSIQLIGTPSGGTFSGSGIIGNYFYPSNTGAGTYSITYDYTNTQGCSNSDAQSITVNAAPLANAGVDQTITSGNSTTLAGSATGGSSSYTYAWTPAAQLVNANIQNPTTVSLSTSTIFTLLVSDVSTGCSDDDIMLVNVGSSFAITVTATDDTICDGSSTHLNVTALGGSGSYTYSWTSVPAGFTSTLQNPVVSPTVNTTYNVAVNDGSTIVNGSKVIVVNALPTVTFTGLSTDYCDNATAATLMGTPSTGFYSGNGIAGNIFTPANASIGQNMIVYTATVNNCSNSDTQYVDVHSTPLANAGTDQIISGPASTTLNGSSTGGANVGYFWTPAAQLVNANMAAPTTVSLSTTTVFTLEARDTLNMCSSTDQVTITVTNVLLTVTASATPSTVCAGDTVLLEAIGSGGGTGNYNYLWSSVPAGFTSTTSTVNAFPLVSTTYTIRIIDGTDTAFANTTVTVNPVPNASFIGLSPNYCNNSGAVSLVGTPAGGTFSGPGISGNQFIPANANIGTNQIAYTITVGGCSGSDYQSTNVSETPVANAGTDIALTGAGSTTLNGSSTGGSNVGYFWTPSSLLVNANMANPTTTTLTTTTTFTLEAKDTVNNCSSTDQMMVTVGGGPVVVTASATPSTICLGDSSSVSAVASGGNGTYTYAWSSNPVGFTSTQLAVKVGPTVTTTYTVIATSGVLSNSTTVVVTVNPLPIVTFSGLTSPACASGSSMTLVGSPSGGVFSGTGVSMVSGSYTFNPAVAGAGTWNIVYNYTNSSGCSNSDNQSVTVSPNPIVNAGVDQTITSGLSASLTGSATGAGNYKYSWTPVSLVASPNSANTQTTVLTASQIFTLAVIDSVTSCNSSDDVLITVSNPNLPVTATSTTLPSTICSGSTAQLNVIASGGSGVYTYTWTSVPAGFTSSIANPVVSPTITTVYSVSVTDGNTSANTNVTVTVNASPVVSFIGLDTSYCNNGVKDTLLGLPSGGFFNGNGMSANIFNPVNAGVGYHNISYTYTGINGCTASDTQLTHVYDAPIANAGSDYTTLSTATLNGNASGGSGNYNWSWTPAALFANANLQNVTTTNNLAMTTVFTLTVEDQTSLCHSTDDVVVTPGGGPLSLNPMATPDTICVGQQVQLMAYAGGGSGNYMYAWISIPSGYIQTVANPIAAPTVTTSYIINIFDGTNTLSDTVTVVVGTIPVVSISPVNGLYCENGLSQLIPATPAGGVFYGSGMSGNLFDPNIAGIGTHQIVYEYTSPLGCGNTDTMYAMVQASPTANAGSDIVIPCNGSGGLIGDNALANMLYQWSPPSGLNQPNMSSTVANPNMNTTYNLTVTDTITGCSNTDQVMVTVTGGPTLTVANDTIICGGESVTIYAISSGTSFLWNNGVTSSAFTISPTTTTVYTVTVSDASTCAAVDSVTVTVNSSYLFLGPDITLYDTQTVVLDAGFGYVSYAWNTGDIGQSIEVNAYVNAQLGLNKYSVEVVDAYGCNASDSVLINFVLNVEDINQNIAFDVYPNPTKGQFTIQIEGTISQTYSLEIVNIQGQVLYQKDINVNSSKYSESIDVSTWAKGVYVLRLKNDQFINTRKLIIQ